MSILCETCWNYWLQFGSKIVSIEESQVNGISFVADVLFAWVMIMQSDTSSCTFQHTKHDKYGFQPKKTKNHRARFSNKSFKLLNFLSLFLQIFVCLSFSQLSVDADNKMIRCKISAAARQMNHRTCNLIYLDSY